MVVTILERKKLENEGLELVTRVTEDSDSTQLNQNEEVASQLLCASTQAHCGLRPGWAANQQ